MIGFLSGRPMFSLHHTILLVNGVGYEVTVTATTRASLIGKETVDVYIYTHVKEDALELYGFLQEREKLLFLLLLDVNGVGPRTAMAIMDRGVEAIITAVQSADVSFFSSIPRVGKKSAQKIIIELKSKLGGDQELQLQEPEGKEKEALDALLSLGFSESESRNVLQTLDLETMRLEDAVKAAIQQITQH